MQIDYWADFSAFRSSSWNSTAQSSSNFLYLVGVGVGMGVDVDVDVDVGVGVGVHNILPHDARRWYCNKRQHTATHCNT